MYGVLVEDVFVRWHHLFIDLIWGSPCIRQEALLDP